MQEVIVLTKRKMRGLKIKIKERSCSLTKRYVISIIQIDPLGMTAQKVLLYFFTKEKGLHF